MPEDAVGAWSSVLAIGFKYFFSMGARQREEFVGVKAGMLGVDFEVSESLQNLGEECCILWRMFESS
jgi:hypothetical protein